MCSGRVEPSFIFHALAKGADGVMIAGCHPGDCHYVEGNYKTLRRIILFKKMIEEFGIDPNRLSLEWISAAEGKKFTNTMNHFTDQIRALGPLNIESVVLIEKETGDEQ